MRKLYFCLLFFALTLVHNAYSDDSNNNDNGSSTEESCKVESLLKTGYKYEFNELEEGHKLWNETLELSYNEIRLSVDAGFINASEIDNNIKWANVRIDWSTSPPNPKSAYLDLNPHAYNYPPHYVNTERKLKIEEMPGHIFTVVDGVRKLTAEYRAENYVHREIYARSKLFANCTDKKDYNPDSFSASTDYQKISILSSDSDLEVPQISKAQYEAVSNKFKILMKFEKPLSDQSKVFLRVLGPVVLGSAHDQRGIIFKADYQKSDFKQGKNKDIRTTLESNQKKMMEFVKNSRENVETAKLLNEFYSQPLDFQAVAFQCVEDKCSDYNRIPVNFQRVDNCDVKKLKRNFQKKVNSLVFGTKSIAADSYSLNEFSFTVKAGKNDTVLDVNGQELQVLLKGFEANDQEIATASYYFPRDNNDYDKHAIPGHHFTLDSANVKTFKAEYAFKNADAKQVSTRIQSTCWNGVYYGESSNVVSLNPGSWDQDVEKPKIEDNVYDDFLEKIEMTVTVSEPQARLFIRILGPVVKGSTKEMRGIVLKYDTEKYSEDGKYVFSKNNGRLKGDQIEQLDFIEKAEKAENLYTLNNFFQKELNGNYSYKVMAFQCNVDSKCSEPVEVELKKGELPAECLLSDVEKLGFSAAFEKFESGVKNLKSKELSFNEYIFTVRGGYSDILESIGDKIKRISVQVSNLGNENTVIYLPDNYDYDISEIPGQLVFKSYDFNDNNGYLITYVRGEYRIMDYREEETINVASTLIVDCEGEQLKKEEVETKGANLTFFNYDKDVQKVVVQAASFLDDELTIRVFSPEESTGNSKLFLRVLGPTVKGSKYKQRGIILSSETSAFKMGQNEYTFKGRFELPDYSKRQLNFLSKHHEDIHKLFEKDPNYIAIAYLCLEENGNTKCGEPTELIIK